MDTRLLLDRRCPLRLTATEFGFRTRVGEELLSVTATVDYVDFECQLIFGQRTTRRFPIIDNIRGWANDLLDVLCADPQVKARPPAICLN